MTYHIKRDGRPGPCEAKTPASCPRGGTHYGTELEAAHAAIDIALSKQGGPKVTVNVKGMNDDGVAHTILMERNIDPEELVRLARDYGDKPRVLTAIVRHPKLDTHVLANVLAENNEDHYLLTAAAYNSELKPEAFDMLIESAVPERRAAVWEALASRNDLLDNHKEALARTSNAMAGLRYAQRSTNPEHLALLAKSDTPTVYLNVFSNRHTRDETLQEVIASGDNQDKIFEASQELLRRQQAKANPEVE